VAGPFPGTDRPIARSTAWRKLRDAELARIRDNRWKRKDGFGHDAQYWRRRDRETIMTTTDRLDWRKPTYSNSSSNCVEVASQPVVVAIRDTKDREGPRLAVRPADWAAFTRRLRDH
jgi:hypothetical protein